MHWPPMADAYDVASDAKKFFECVEDNFLTQHVVNPTRHDAILDLIVTDEPDMLKELTDMGSFGNSDHNVLWWGLQYSSNIATGFRQVFDYSKANIAGMKQDLKQVDWCGLLSGSSTQKCWDIFKSKLLEVQCRHIPQRATVSK